MTAGKNRTKNKAASQAASVRKPEEVEVIDAILKKLGVQLQEDKTKGTITDFIRLLQLRNELDGEDVKEVKVQWVEESQECDAS